jgi:Acetyl-CoA hydrolase/transferase C-terminal domain
MMVTLLGAAVSDQLQSGQVVSGVGGQYNFVAMAHALPDARSILCVRATRTHEGRTTSNILWSYGHETIPRHLRDIVVTEYGVADLRGRTDEEVIAALLNVADSRFQEELLARARQAGKIRAGYRIPEPHRDNLPQRLARCLRPAHAAGFFSDYPFGTDLTAEEIAVARALKYLGARTAGGGARLRSTVAALLARVPAARHTSALKRMGLEHPRGARAWLEQRLLAWALEATAADS